MASTDLKLEECGSLPKPRFIGRTVRLVFGISCLYYVFGLWTVRSHLISETGSISSLIWNGILPSLFLISYVINIGLSRAWKKWPAYISVIFLIVAATLGYIQEQSIESQTLASSIWAWELYLYSHLGVAFSLSALIGTVGCEMRAFHHLYSLITGRSTKEHHCPIGPLSKIDEWEASRHDGRV